MSQQLIPTADGRGRAMSLEIMVATPAIRNLIREEKVHQIYSAMQAGLNDSVVLHSTTIRAARSVRLQIIAAPAVTSPLITPWVIRGREPLRSAGPDV